MNRIAFKMKLNPGMREEYERRHNNIWPELKELLHSSGVSDYSIFLDEDTHLLIGVLLIADRDKFQRLPLEPVMQRWWQYMKDIMESNSDGSPVSYPLEEVFYLP